MAPLPCCIVCARDTTRMTHLRNQHRLRERDGTPARELRDAAITRRGPIDMVRRRSGAQVDAGVRRYSAHRPESSQDQYCSKSHLGSARSAPACQGKPSPSNTASVTMFDGERGGRPPFTALPLA
jgi:hypothetical protein